MPTEQNKSPPYTPGPWWKDDHGFIAAGNGDTYVTIADFDCSNDIGIGEREANKNLALAAHDMLIALYHAQAEMLAFSMPVPPSVTAAIAKARGKQ
jgi:hypothetical protein